MRTHNGSHIDFMADERQGSLAALLKMLGTGLMGELQLYPVKEVTFSEGPTTVGTLPFFYSPQDGERCSF